MAKGPPLKAPLALIKTMSLVQVVSSVVAQLAKGIPIHKISVPAFIHAPESQLDTLVKALLTYPNTLEAWSKVDEEEDLYNRFGLVLEAIINPHANFGSDKPFNSILGEFVEAESIWKDESHKIRIERISHHPPVSGYILEGPNYNLYTPNGMSAGTMKPGT